MDPELVGGIMVELGFVDKSECVEVETKPVKGRSPTRVNEKDKKLGIHCAT